MPPFREVQRFHENWIGLVAILGTAAVFAGVVVVSATVDETTDPLVIGLSLGLCAPLVGLLWYPPMITEVHHDHLSVRFPPFRPVVIRPADISSFEATTYRPIREFGGWGRRGLFGPKRAMNVSGDRGVRIHLVDGRQYLIGSLRPDELAEALRQMR